MLTQAELKQIRDYLLMYGKKDSELPAAETPLTGFEQVAIVQQGINKLTPLSEIQETLKGDVKKDVLTYNDYLTLVEQGRVDATTIYVCTTEDGTQVIQIYLQGYPFMPTSEAEFSFSLNRSAVYIGEATSTTLSASASPIASDIKFYDGDTLLDSTTDNTTLSHSLNVDSNKTFTAKAHILGNLFTQNRSITAVNHIYWGAGATDAVLNTTAMHSNDKDHYSAQNVPFNLQAIISNAANDYIYLEIPNEWQLNKIELYDNPSFPTELGMTQITTPRAGYKAYKSNYDRAVGEHVYRIFIKSI